jgi:glycosyltransferase involved in cell wall biosynthesis
MTDTSIQYQIKNIAQKAGWSEIYYGTSTTKIEAVNADITTIPWNWEMVVLVSDDMVPQVKGYDDVLRSHMIANYADTDGILWVNDGTQANNLNTISIMGRKMYDSFGYLYYPAYKSLFCDTEFTDLCKGPLSSKCTYIPYILIKHEHPGTGFPQRDDALYRRNNSFWYEDMMTYISRKQYEYDWTIMIPTITGRETILYNLLQTIEEHRKSICPSLKIEIRLSFDNREKRIGAKRQELLTSAKGKYISFIDDDDLVTDSYFEDALATIQGNYHVCRLRGKMNEYTFTHSVENTLDKPMCEGDVFLRPPNHLNILLSDVGKLISFKNGTRGEDLDWAIQLAKTNCLKLEYKSDPSRIHYIYNLRGHSVPLETLELQRRTNYETMLKMVWLDGDAVPPKIETGPSGLRLSGRGFVSK